MTLAKNNVKTFFKVKIQLCGINTKIQRTGEQVFLPIQGVAENQE